MVDILDDLIDEVGENESHPFASLMETLGSLIEANEIKNDPDIESAHRCIMDELMLFADGSVNTQTNIGYGAYLAVSERGLSLNSMKTSVKVRRFEHTSSTKLELQTLLWALNDIQALGRKVILYTDSQNILGLRGRRERFEQHDYRSKKNQRLSNYELYQEFYRMIDHLDCELIKARGHQVSHQKDEISKLFTLVDRAARKAVREDNRGPVVSKQA